MVELRTSSRQDHGIAGARAKSTPPPPPPRPRPRPRVRRHRPFSKPWTLRVLLSMRRVVNIDPKISKRRSEAHLRAPIVRGGRPSCTALVLLLVLVMLLRRGVHASSSSSVLPRSARDNDRSDCHLIDATARARRSAARGANPIMVVGLQRRGSSDLVASLQSTPPRHHRATHPCRGLQHDGG